VPARTVQQALLDDSDKPSALFAVNNMAGSAYGTYAFG
jgi:hypothetical protein